MSTHSDGEVVFGSQILTFGGIFYIAETIDVSRTVQTTQVPDENKTPVKQAFVKTVMTGTAVLQLETATTPAPAIGSVTWMIPVGGTLATRPFFVTSVGEVFRTDGVAKVNIGLTEKLDGNAIADPVWFDGDTSVATPITPWRVHHDRVTYAYIYRRTFVQHADFFGHTGTGAVCPANASAFLADETEPTEFGIGKLIQFDRVYTTVPPARVEYENISYPYQQEGTIGTTNVVANVNLSRIAVVTYDYHHTTNPGAISMERLPRTMVFNNTFTRFDGFTNLGYGAYTVAADAQLTKWMGNIWQRKRFRITI